MLNIIGTGLYDFDDISLRAKHLIEESDIIYLEYYTSKLKYDSKEQLIDDFKKKFNTDLIIAYRKDIENKEEDIMQDAKTQNVTVLVIGDAISATTHTELILNAKQQDIKVNIVHNASVFNGVAVTGLQLYKFGKTASLVFEDTVQGKTWLPETPYKILRQNKSIDAHTLFLLDINIDTDDENFMTIPEAIDILLKLDKTYKDKYDDQSIFNEDTFVIGCARLGNDDYFVKSGKAKDIIKMDFGQPLHCLIVPGTLHFIEEDMLEQYNKKDE